MSVGKFSVKETVELAMMTALIIGGKEAMNILPNIHPVALLLVFCVMIYGAKALLVALSFSLIEIGIYGASTMFYLYTWPLLVLCALPFRKKASRLFWAFLTGIFGLCFGALGSIQYLFIGGWKAALSYWVSGIPFDLLHGFGNAAMTFFLLAPLCRVASRIKNQ